MADDARARRTAAMVLASLLLALSLAMIAVVDHAAAASCGSTVSIGGPSGGGKLSFTPTSATIQLGGCVEYDNKSAAPVSLTVTEPGASTKKASIPQNSSATVTPGAVGKATVAASEPSGLLGIGGTATGSTSITVKPAPGSSSSASPQPSGKHSSTPTAKPDVAPNPKKHHKTNGKGKHTPRPHATGIKLPPLPPLPTAGITALLKASNPLVAPGPASAPAVTDTSTPVAAVISGPIEPGSSNGRGLPEAIAVLVVLGLVSGWGRVLLATSGSVDSDPAGRHRS